MFTEDERNLLSDIIAEEKRISNHNLEHRVQHHSNAEKKELAKIALLNKIERKIYDI